MIITLPGCAFRFTSFENLMRPPKLIGKYQVLQDAFEATLGNQKFSLLTPETGDFRSSFLTYDVDSDGDEEAFVFYILADKPEIAKVSYFEYSSEEWKFICTNDGLGNTIDKVVITDFNRDGLSEVIVGWSLYSNKTNKVFSEYSISATDFTQKSSHPYSHFDVVDVNGDGYNDVLTLTVDTSVPDKRSAIARVYNFDRSASVLSLFGETALDGNISSYSMIKTESVSDKNYIYIESLKGMYESITELIYWDDETNKLISPLFDIASQSTILTWRNINISVYDVDSDGFLEIPTSVEMPGSVVTTTDNMNSSSTVTSDNNPITKLYFTKWIKYRDGKIIPVQYSIVNKFAGYMLNVKSTWVGKITVSGNDGQWDYYRWNSKSNTIGDLLFSIYSYDNKDETAKKKYSSYDILKSTSGKTYVYQITSEGVGFGITKELLDKNLVLTDLGG